MTVAFAEQAPDTLETALAYARLGWPVLPICRPLFTPDGKPLVRRDGSHACTHDLLEPDRRPKGSRSGNPCDGPGKQPHFGLGAHGATTDEATIRGWWARAGGHALNHALVMGHGRAALDVDSYKGGDDGLAALVAAIGPLPDTAEFLTGGGGRHLIFEDPVPGGVGQASPRLPDGSVVRGIDVRSRGGYIVGPGSLHANGRLYVAEASSDPLEGVEPARLPDALIERLRAPAAGAAGGAREAGARIPVGERKKTFVSLAGTMWRRGMSEDAIVAALLITDATECEEPLGEPEVRRIVKTVTRKPRDGRPKFRVVNPDDPPPAPREREPGDDDGDEAPAFERGDEVEIARRLLADLQADSPVGLVFDRNELWRYGPEAGVYRRVPDHDARRAAAAYAGVMVHDGKRAKPLRLSAGAVKGAVTLAGSFAAVEGFFDDAPVGIAFRNGFVVVERGVATLLAHGPERRAQHVLPFDYAPDAPAERWRRYLEEVFALPGEAALSDEQRALVAADRADRIALLQEFVGACLLGMAARLAVCLVLTGEGANGKSVFLTVVKALFPAAATVSLAPQLWENRFYLAELAGVRLNAVAELPERDILESDAFKAVVAGDPVMVARKHQRPFTLRPGAGHVFACNALPGTKDQTEGFWRRFAVVPFERRFAEHERDLHLDEALLRELPGIAAWAIEGACRLQAQGRYTSPASSRDAKREWQHDSDQVRQFVEECCEVDADVQATLTDVYLAFALWARRTGHGGLARNRLGNRLKQLGHADRSKLGRFYRLRIKPAVWAEVRRDGNSRGSG
jgi:P4 family phage/plasmid primase-like protien